MYVFMIEDIIYNWSIEKNKILIKDRWVSFEEVVYAVKDDKILDVIKNPSSNYDNQYCYIIEINNYVYLVPFVVNKNEYFLKTIYPSRKYTKIYLK